MSRTRQLWVLLALGLALGACSDDTQQPDRGPTPKPEMKVGGDAGKLCSTTPLLPADNAVGDYKRQAAAETAFDAASLQALIDGGSEKYAQNQFVCMSRVTYASATTGANIEVWAFDQTDAAGATAAMDAAATGTDLTPTIGDASKEDTTLVTSYIAFARKGRVLVRVVASKKAASADAVALLKAVINAAP